VDNLKVSYVIPYTRTECPETDLAYRFGYQGSEKESDIYGDGNTITTLYRFGDLRLGKWFSVDPKEAEMPWQTPYNMMDGNPVFHNDILGDCPTCPGGGQYISGTSKAPKMTKEFALNLATYTDVNDAAVLVTTLTRLGNSVNADGTKANNVDKGFAIAGAFIPFVGGSTVKQILKKGANLTEHLYDISKVASTLIRAKTGALRNSLLKQGIDLAGKEAHHIIPTQLLGNNKVVQDAVAAGFDFNGITNGIGLSKVADGGVHANHPNYSKQIANKLNAWADKNKGYSPEQAKEFLTGVAENLKTQIQKESVNGGKKVNELIIK
jgi:hypothetical protein